MSKKSMTLTLHTTKSVGANFAMDVHSDRPLVAVSTLDNMMIVFQYEGATPLISKSNKNANQHSGQSCFLDRAEKLVGVGPMGDLQIWDARGGEIIQSLPPKPNGFKRQPITSVTASLP